MPFCGFHPKMVTGLATFAEGLFAATLERAEAKGITIEEAYRQEVEELGVFLEALERRYQEVKASGGEDRGAIMNEVAEWAVQGHTHENG
jgi:hypothetical protein